MGEGEGVRVGGSLCDIFSYFLDSISIEDRSVVSAWCPVASSRVVYAANGGLPIRTYSMCRFSCMFFRLCSSRVPQRSGASRLCVTHLTFLSSRFISSSLRLSASLFFPLDSVLMCFPTLPAKIADRACSPGSTNRANPAADAPGVPWLLL